MRGSRKFCQRGSLDNVFFIIICRIFFIEGQQRFFFSFFLLNEGREDPHTTIDHQPNAI